MLSTSKNKVPGPADLESKKWQTEDDLRSLQRASEVLSDPGRKKAATQMHVKQHETLMATMMSGDGGDDGKKKKKIGKEY